MQKPAGFRHCPGCGIIMPISDSHPLCLISLGEELGKEECSTPNSWGVLGGIHPCEDWRSSSHLLVRTFQYHHFTPPRDPSAFVWLPLQGSQKSDLLSGRWRGKVPPFFKLCSEMSRSDGFCFEVQELLLEPKKWLWELLCLRFITSGACALQRTQVLCFSVASKKWHNLLIPLSLSVSSSLLPAGVPVKSPVWHQYCLIFSWWSYASPGDQLCPADQCILPSGGSPTLHLCLVYRPVSPTSALIVTTSHHCYPPVLRYHPTLQCPQYTPCCWLWDSGPLFCLLPFCLCQWCLSLIFWFWAWQKTALQGLGRFLPLDLSILSRKNLCSQASCSDRSRWIGNCWALTLLSSLTLFTSMTGNSLFNESHFPWPFPSQDQCHHMARGDRHLDISLVSSRSVICQLDTKLSSNVVDFISIMDLS